MLDREFVDALATELDGLLCASSTWGDHTRIAVGLEPGFEPFIDGALPARFKVVQLRAGVSVSCAKTGMVVVELTSEERGDATDWAVVWGVAAMLAATTLDQGD